MGNVHMEATQINYREGDKKMSVAQAIKNAGNTGLAHTADIAPEFSTDSAYSAGDFVYHNGSLYEFTANHAAGAWSTDDTQAATVGGKITSLEGDVADLNGIKANQITIAPAFSASASYDPGDLVYYNGLSYRCVNAHEGEWDADDFAATTISNELASLMSGLTSVTANAYGNYIDISGYTSDMYTCDSDGYLLMATNTTSTITVYVYGRIGNDYMSVSSVNGINTTVYVRKGMRLLVHDTTGTSTVARFYPLVV